MSGHGGHGSHGGHGGHGHGHGGHGGGDDRLAAFTPGRPAAEAWDDFYRQSPRLWSGRPNARLVEVAEDLAPGRALDLGCGEGGDAVWLAGRGWTVTAVDVATTALARTQELAAERGVAVTTEQHDLTATLPSGSFDLVSACFLQSPLEWDRGALLRRVATAVEPGGLLLVVDHGAVRPPWGWHDEGEVPTARQLRASVGLDDWEDVRVDDPEREATGPDGQVGTVSDAVVLLRRPA